jgi:PKD repeat protein
MLGAQSLSLLLALALGACQGSGEVASVLGSPAATASPSASQLNAHLETELLKLGKDISKQAMAAPSSGNAVFDLSAEIIDADGPGPLPPTSVELRWTERLLGDYNQDSLVSVGDLSQIGIHFNKSVGYLSAIDRFGIEWWPSGSPDLDQGAANWRLARVDGNFDGLVSIQDVTTIAQHWQEHLTGYRVYRKAPGESDFSLLPDPTALNDDLSIPRDAALDTDGDTHPLRYVYFDSSEVTSGEYQYYVAAYDPISGLEGPPSVIVTPRVNSLPVAELAAAPQIGARPLLVSFDAAASNDADGDTLSFEWDLDGDGSFELNSGSDADTEFTYNANGEFDAAVRVTDSNGASATDSVPIAVGGNLLARFDALPERGVAPLEVFFDPSDSLSTEGIASYAWDFDGDGMADLETPHDGVVSHVFEAVQSYNAMLTVTDNVGAQSQATVLIDVEQEVRASFTANPQIGRAPLNVALDASSSVGVGDLTYTWLINPGNLVFEDNAPVLVQVFGPGAKTIELVITDADGNSDSTSQVVIVQPAIEPSFTVQHNGSPTFPFAGTLIPTTQPLEPGESIAKFEWDCTGDSSSDIATVPGVALAIPGDNFDLDSGSEKFINYFPGPGPYIIALTAVDSQGTRGTVYQQLDLPLNSVPDAELAATPAAGIAPLQVLLAATPAGPDEDGIASIAWDFDGNGSSDLISPGADLDAAHIYAEPGDYTPSVTITDGKGGSATASLGTPISVIAPPVDAQFDFEANGVEVPADVDFDASASTSSTSAITAYQWDWESDGIYDSTSGDPTVTHTFTQERQTVTLRVINNDLESDTRTRSVRIGQADILIIDNNPAPAQTVNLAELILDIESLNLVHSSQPYFDGIAESLVLDETPIYIWYRGGPGPGESPPMNALWTDAEIDDYIQLMQDGHNLLLMSQSHGIEQVGVPFNGWQNAYAGTLLPPSIGSGPPWGTPDKRRHPWAAGSAIDSAVGFSGDAGFFSFGPTSFVASLGGRFSADSSHAAERFSGAGSSGSVPVAINFSSNSQFCGIGYFAPFTGASHSPSFHPGVTAFPPVLGFNLGYMSWGNQAAPDANIGDAGAYSHVAGPARLWVVGYPWAALSVTNPAGMQRSAVLQNTLAWLDADDGALEWPE